MGMTQDDALPDALDIMPSNSLEFIEGMIDEPSNIDWVIIPALPLCFVFLFFKKKKKLTCSSISGTGKCRILRYKIRTNSGLALSRLLILRDQPNHQTT
jgi:hypothetical protein